MKRFHVHVNVADLDESVGLYPTFLVARPSFRHDDYAKWILEDPRMNFAISIKRQPSGSNHVGFQVDSDDELREFHAQLKVAVSQLIQEDVQACCYAKSDKYWVTDPTGVARKTFHTSGHIPVYGDDTPVVDHGKSTTPVPCCMPETKAPLSAEKRCCG